ncbi:cysteine desulfurase sulfur acceptor subunit CsdE [Enterovibrio nigricans]|uniref:Cysteine desulfuration protein SufE n=1 Tax=Enterovibrio nigricans DSM 22720 TaxID=1121868 RepID=A0A1T4UBU4_9GAMM|nr:cysteine desulfurase sulfur acceptor subunit CsdE [Enterovibrio nigricans]PKF51494.1 cysteine desulfurase sulfur acceptor subunit CsdE [Enterovibrio nigricans]SKA50215.1 cysteine desulfuration protein SufE [Enterovibrio nigricans DSM 22720]
MNSFPAHPFGTDITTDVILSQMANCRSWEDKYRVVIQLGKKLPVLSEAQKMHSLNVPGCESKVWLSVQEKENLYYFSADSDARIVKGLLAIVLAAVEGKTREDIQSFQFDDYFKSMDLIHHLSESRSNGMYAIIEQIRTI